MRMVSKQVQVIVLGAVMVLLTSGRARADVIDFFARGDLPSQGTYLTSWGSTGLGFITDGTSNTITFGETTSITLCFDGVGVSGGSGSSTSNPIIDGSSNTIQFTESSGFRVNGGRVVSRRPIGQITDGTSNTIQIGEIPSNTFCLSDVRATPSEITDGTSNTILIGETSDFDVCVGSGAGRVCVEDVRVPGSGPANGSAIPEPTTAALLLAGLGLSACLRRTRRRRDDPRCGSSTSDLERRV
jgi:hypothetical protein